METGRVASFEALVRWRHPERGTVGPGDFIPVAEETGLIVPLGLWVLNEACLQMREWQRLGLADETVTMSVNLSSRQFSQADLIDQIASALRESGLKAANLKLEITESMVMENIDTAIDMLMQLRGLGVGLSIDDFGTGYSSLSYLHRFPIDTLKIDRSFVTQMTDNSENAEIVRTIVTLARSLDMDGRGGGRRDGRPAPAARPARMRLRTGISLLAPGRRGAGGRAARRRAVLDTHILSR